MSFNLILLLIISLGSVSNASKNVKLGSFSWSECGSASEVIQIQSLQVSPDPLIIPGNISLEFQASASLTESSPLPISLKIQKKVTFFWVTIPCVDGTGSCDYKDLCTFAPKDPSKCPTVFKSHSIPCQCPIKSGNYNLPLSQIYTVKSGSLPSWLESGDYKIEAKVNDSSGKEILCLDISLTLKTD